jgi:hypothetical protein
MPVPGIFVTFQSTAAAAIEQSDKGVVAILLRDDAELDQQQLTLTRSAQIPTTLSEANQAYLRRAFLGYVNAPKKVLVFVDAADATDLTAGLSWAQTQTFDYLCAPPDVTSEEAQAVASWVKEERTAGHMVKVVLPNLAADNEGVVNFATSDIIVAGATLSTAQYCSRIAGLIAGTPMKIACTYAPLAEVEDFKRLSGDDADDAVDAGKLILIHDGVKAKIARGVNSLVTTTQDKGESFQKIKIIEVLDMVYTDITQSIADSYIGKYVNSYDNKRVLCTAIKAYLSELERNDLVKRDSSTVEIDLEAQTLWLEARGTDISDMDEQEILEADTGSYVFLSVSFKPLDAIEDVKIPISI